jgi:hypothetical protein
MGCAVPFELRIARSGSGYENCRGLITREGEVGRVSGLCIECALRKRARLSVVGLAAISKVTFTRDNHCEPIIAVGISSGHSAGVGCRSSKYSKICVESKMSRSPCTNGSENLIVRFDNNFTPIFLFSNFLACLAVAFCVLVGRRT